MACRAEGGRGRNFGADFANSRIFPVARDICISYKTVFFQPSGQPLTHTHRNLYNDKADSETFCLFFAFLSEVLRSSSSDKNIFLDSKRGRPGRSNARSMTDASRDTFAAYVRLLLSVPLFSRRANIDHSPYLEALVSAWGIVDLSTLPPNPFPAAPSIVGVVSNMSFILAAVLPTVAKPSCELDIAQLRHVWVDGLTCLARFLRQCPPLVASSESVISFEKKGACLTTHAIDPVVVATLQTVFSEDFLRALLLWITRMGFFDEQRADAFLKVR